MDSLVQVSPWWWNPAAPCQAAGPPQPLCDGTWGRIRQRSGFWRSHVARPEHPKEVAPQECSSNHSSSYYLATRDVSLGLKPLCWRWDTHGAATWWGSGYKAPRDTLSPQRRGAWLMPRGTGEPAGLYVLCRIRWRDRCGRFLQSARVPRDTLGQAHPFHYTVARASPAPGRIARDSLPATASAWPATIPWLAFY